jgi:hypothetical protein
VIFADDALEIQYLRLRQGFAAECQELLCQHRPLLGHILNFAVIGDILPSSIDMHHSRLVAVADWTSIVMQPMLLATLSPNATFTHVGLSRELARLALWRHGQIFVMDQAGPAALVDGQGIGMFGGEFRERPIKLFRSSDGQVGLRVFLVNLGRFDHL